MERRNKIYCYLQERGQIEFNDDERVKCNGEQTKRSFIYHGMSFYELLDGECERLNINKKKGKNCNTPWNMIQIPFKI